MPEKDDVLEQQTQAGQEPAEGVLEVSLPDKQGVEVEVVDDTPEEDRGRPPRDPNAPEPDEYASDEELKQYSKGVQERIKRLKFDYHDQRRKREAAERQLQEAIEYAKAVAAQAAEMKKLLEVTGGYATEEAKARVGSQLDQVRAQLADALERGDHEKAVLLQEQLALLVADKQRAESMQVQVPDIPPPPQAVAQPQPKVSPRALRWREQNDSWWEKDREKTAFAVSTHMALLLSGVHPDSDEYYAQLNRTLERYDQVAGAQREPQRKKESPHVSPVVRQEGNKMRVRLTQSQIDLARQMGISLEEYVEQVILREKSHA